MTYNISFGFFQRQGYKPGDQVASAERLEGKKRFDISLGKIARAAIYLGACFGIYQTFFRSSSFGFTPLNYAQKAALKHGMHVLEEDPANPNALLIFAPSTDYNGAFEPSLLPFRHLKEDLIYKVLDDPLQMCEYIKDIGSRKKIKAVVLQGHGSKDLIHVAWNKFICSDQKSLFAKPFYHCVDLPKDCFEALDPEAVINLDSCSTGKAPDGVAWKIHKLAKRNLMSAMKLVSKDQSSFDPKTLKLSFEDELGVNINKEIKWDSQRTDQQYFLEVLEEHPLSFAHASETFRDNEEFAMKAVMKVPLNFEHVSERFRDSELIALEAVKRNLLTIQHLSPRLANSEEFALKALKLNAKSFQYLPKKLQENEAIALVAVTGDFLKNNFLYVSERLKGNEVIALEAVVSDMRNFRYLSKSLQENQKIFGEVKKQLLDYHRKRSFGEEEPSINTVEAALKFIDEIFP